ncbi:MAG: hypothetical protein WCI55_08860 [Armatimonadota bacterium]
MEIQELSSAFAALETRVEKTVSQQSDLKYQLNASKLKSIKGKTQRSPAWDIVVAGLALIVTGGFVAGNLNELQRSPITAIPAMIVYALCILTINVSARQLILSSELDYSKPMVETQLILAKLRKLRVRSTQWIFVSAFVLWLVFPILLGQMLISPKFMLAMNPAWIVGNIIFGLLMVPVIDWIMIKSKYSNSIQDELAGKDVREAEEFVKQIREFQAV